MEYRTFLGVSPPIEQAIDMQTAQQSSASCSRQDMNAYFYSAPRMRVSEKLLQNRLRKLELQCKSRQQKQCLLQRRRKREKQIFEFQQKRQVLAQEQREANLRSNRFQSNSKQKEEQEKQLEKLSRLKASDAMIDLCRKKVEERKNQYIFRIQSKTRERQERAQMKRQIKERATQKASDQVHFQEWRQYQAQILKKHQGELKRPDRLYEQFKSKNVMIRQLFDKNSKEKQNNDIVQIIPQKIQDSCLPASLKRSNTAQILFKSNKKIEFFGVHQEDMLKQGCKDIAKMRKFIEENSMTMNPCQDKQLLQKFQSYLMKEILK